MDAPAALRAEGISQARDGTARLRMRGVTLHDATAAEIAAQAARETRSAARMSGVPLKVIKDWKEGMTQEERERVIGEQKLTEEQVATLDATAHARALAEAAGDQTLTLEEEVVEINRQIEKLGEADEAEAVQMLDAELLAEEEAARAEEEARSESPKAEEAARNEGEGAPRAEVPAEAKPDAGGGEAAGRELEALRVRAAELDDRLRRKGLRKAERSKIAEELAGVQARMQELSGGNLVLFSRGEAASARPALSPTKAALRDRLLLKIARTAGIRVIREGTEAIEASAARAQGAARLNAMRRRKLKPHEWFVASAADYARLASQVGTLWHERGNVDAYYLDGAVFVCVKGKGFGEFAVADVFSVDVPYEEFEARRAGISRELANAPKGKAGSFVGLYRNEFLRDNGITSRAENGNADAGNGAIPDNSIRRDGEDADAGRSDAGDVVHTADGQVFAYRVGGAYGKEHYAKDAAARGLRYSREVLKHGSPHWFAAEEGAPYGRFRDDKMGTGEGAQAFGWGHYLTSREGIARVYTKSNKYVKRASPRDVAFDGIKIPNNIILDIIVESPALLKPNGEETLKKALADYWGVLGTTSRRIWNQIRPEDISQGLALLENKEFLKKLKAVALEVEIENLTREADDLESDIYSDVYSSSFTDEEINAARKEIEDYRKQVSELKKQLAQEGFAEHNLYTTEIETGENDANLLDWTTPMTSEQEDRLFAQAERELSEGDMLNFKEAFVDGRLTAEQVHESRELKEVFGSPEGISKFLHRAGFIGHKFPANSMGRGDYSKGTNYVIYSGEDIAITDAVRWLRDGEGVVYGYWDEARGELHLNEDFADFDTPLHEWAHVWLSWVRKADARLAERALAVTKETKFYKRLREDKGSAYAGLSDDALAEEAFAMLCGKDGGEIMAEEGVSTWTKLRRAVLNVFKAALRTLGISEGTLSRLTFKDMQSLCLRDLLDDETLSLKELRASVSAKRALEDAASEAIIDNGIKDAARNRAIRSASIAAAGKLLMKKERMTREQAESAETLSALEESVGRMLPTEPADVVKSAAKAAQLAAKVVYSSRAKGDEAIVDSAEAVREASRAGRGRVLFGRGCFCLQKAACARRL